MLKILVTGCKGRMGQAVTDCVNQDSATEVGAGIDMGDSLANRRGFENNPGSSRTKLFNWREHLVLANSKNY